MFSVSFVFYCILLVFCDITVFICVQGENELLILMEGIYSETIEALNCMMALVSCLACSSCVSINSFILI